MHILIVAAAAFLGNLTIQWFTIRRFTTGLHDFWPNLDKTVQWWWGLPIGPMPLWIIGSIAFAIVCALAVLYAWRANDSLDSDDRPAIRV
ncbi:hypothetical protein [Salinibacterium sp. ZJ450]|uniref:hypothetical protein n=1 Tax=Salinibacterium sp. ZJ450 TaxID=2708338 RepID=UPI001422D408|nr:hypothetical protein [Salinibacterium sp. ZJ450]